MHHGAPRRWKWTGFGRVKFVLSHPVGGQPRRGWRPEHERAVTEARWARVCWGYKERLRIAKALSYREAGCTGGAWPGRAEKEFNLSTCSVPGAARPLGLQPEHRRQGRRARLLLPGTDRQWALGSRRVDGPRQGVLQWDVILNNTDSHHNTSQGTYCEYTVWLARKLRPREVK